MMNYLPPPGSAVTFRDAMESAKPKFYRGEVIEHVPPDPEWGEGFLVRWPTMRYKKAKGCVIFHSIPNLWLETEGPSC